LGGQDCNRLLLVTLWLLVAVLEVAAQGLVVMAAVVLAVY
jgi:hypothetical protein